MKFSNKHIWANSVDPDLLLQEQSDQGLHYFRIFRFLQCIIWYLCSPLFNRGLTCALHCSTGVLPVISIVQQGSYLWSPLFKKGLTCALHCSTGVLPVISIVQQGSYLCSPLFNRGLTCDLHCSTGVLPVIKRGLLVITTVQQGSYLWSPLFNRGLTCALHCSTGVLPVISTIQQPHQMLPKKDISPYLYMLLSHQPGSYLWSPLFKSHIRCS